MNNSMHDVIQHRGELLARIASQRGVLAKIGERLEAPLAIADQGWAVARYLKSKPMLTASIAAFIVLKRRGFSGLLKRVWGVWVGYRYFVRLTSRFLFKT